MTISPSIATLGTELRLSLSPISKRSSIHARVAARGTCRESSVSRNSSPELLRRPIEIHREARRHNQISGDILDSEFIQLPREHHRVLVIERRVAAANHQIAIQRAGARSIVPLAQRR